MDMPDVSEYGAVRQFLSIYVLYRTLRYNFKLITVYFQYQNSITDYTTNTLKGATKIMEIEKLKKTTIERLKKVKAEQGLSVSRIMEMLEAKGKFVSEATVKRIFSEGSEDFNFRYQDSIAPLADVLLDLYGDTSGLDEVNALKQIIHDKNQTIEFMMIKFEEQKASYERNVAHLKGQIHRLNERLDVRERSIERKDAIMEKLLNAYILRDNEELDI